MTDLPILPVRTVLFPGMLLPMRVPAASCESVIEHCRQHKLPIGVVLAHAEGRRHGFSFHQVGTLADIAEAKRVGDDLSLSLLGKQRIRAQSLTRQHPFLQADIELYPMAPETLHERRLIQHVLGGSVHRLLSRYTELLVSSTGTKVQLVHMPSNPATLGFLTAIVLQVSLETKQALLEMPSYYALLREEQRILRRETALLSYIAETQEDEELGWPPLPKPSWN